VSKIFICLQKAILPNTGALNNTIRESGKGTTAAAFSDKRMDYRLSSGVSTLQVLVPQPEARITSSELKRITSISAYSYLSFSIEITPFRFS
jgi:hypothetical protein